MSINRQIPGPAIHVCRDDLVVVDVVNAMAGSAASIHWHGLHMRDTPHMDGVPFITQVRMELFRKVSTFHAPILISKFAFNSSAIHRYIEPDSSNHIYSNL